METTTIRASVEKKVHRDKTPFEFWGNLPHHRIHPGGDFGRQLARI